MSAPMSSSSQIQWFWQEHGQLKAYDPTSTQMLESAKVMGQPKVVLCNGKYEVNFSAMVQTNLVTGYQRSVIRQSSSGGSNGWTWQNDYGGMSNFNPTISDDIEKEYQKGVTAFNITFNRFPYTIDFTAMQQINLQTGKTRPIGRIGGTKKQKSDSGGMKSEEEMEEKEEEYEMRTDSPIAAFVEKVPESEGTSEGKDGDGDDDEEEECSICLDDFEDESAVKLIGCGHQFHAKCLEEWFKHQSKCPKCNKIYGENIGNMPEGNMSVRYEAGYKCTGFSVGTHLISYSFSSGIQGPNHPHPGQHYSGTHRSALIPDTTEGREVLDLLKRAFKNKQTFKIGDSVTTGQRNCVVWNGIHHKTSPSGGSHSFGFPDDDYFRRVKEELKLKGITP